MRRAALGLALLVASPPARAQQAGGAVVTVRAEPPQEPARLVFSAEKAAEAAGTQSDPVKVLQSLPGLGRGGPGSDFVAWGSEPRESSIEVDGVAIPRLYHGSGVRSVLPPALLESLSVTPGAFGAAHGRATGGLVELKTRPLALDASELAASADTLDAAALVSTPIVTGQSALRAAARYGYVDRWLPGVIDAGARPLYDVPAYWDASAAVEARLPRGAELRLVGISSSDSSAFELSSADPSSARRFERASRFGRVYAVYHARAPADEVELTPFVGWDDTRQSERIAGRASFIDESAWRAGLRARYRTRPAEAVVLELGLDAAATSTSVTRSGSLSVPRREGDPYPFGTPPGSGYARDDFRVREVGVGSYAALSLHSGAFRVTPALRLEPSLLEVSRTRPPIAGLPDIGASRVELLAEPRLYAEAQLDRRVRLFAAAGLYHQPPDAADLGARFGNPQLGFSRARHLALGDSTQLGRRTRLELTLFAKWLSDLAVRASDPTPGLAQALVATGEGRALGTQLLLRQGELHGFSGWLSVTLSRSERRKPSGGYRLSDYDSPLVLALVLEQVLGDWRLGARARYATGLPRTPVVGAFYDLASSSYQPELGALNSARLRPFAELDLRVDRAFSLGERSRLEVYLDCLNVTFQQNQEQIVYASDFRSYGSVSGLPPLVVLGVKVER